RRDEGRGKRGREKQGALHHRLESFLALRQGRGSLSQRMKRQGRTLVYRSPQRRMRSFFIRTGLAALGLLYVAMGVVSARVAFVGASEKGRGGAGALTFLLERPYGPFLLGAVVAGLAGIAMSNAVGALRDGRGSGARLLQAVNAVGYGILAWSAARALLNLGR